MIGSVIPGISDADPSVHLPVTPPPMPSSGATALSAIVTPCPALLDSRSITS
jgi:hypothetical protein